MEEIKTVKYEAPTVREDEHATQEEAINNIQAGNVATADNLTYELSLIYRKVATDYATDSPPQFSLTIPMGTPGTESVIEFKSGYKLGITYVGGDITQLQEIKTYETWIASPNEAENTLTTAAGTPCNYKQPVGGRFYFSYYDESQQEHVMQIDELTYTIGLVGELNGDIREYDETQLMSFVWGSHATERNAVPGHDPITWSQQYGPDHVFVQLDHGSLFPYATCMQGFVDASASQNYEIIEYPGEETDDYGGGGDGLFQDIDDIIEGGHAPTVNPLGLGFVKVYNPSYTDCLAIADWLWSDNFDQNIKKNFASPFENIISFGYAPLYGLLGTMQQESMVVGNCQADGNDGAPLIQLNKVTNYAIKVDCGELSQRKITKFWNGFLDYNSVFTLWLPFVGFRSIRADDIFNVNDRYGAVKLTCWIDVLTGMIVWEVHSLINGGNKVVATFSGNCLSQMPISGANFMSMYNQQLSAAVAGNQNLISKIGNALGGIASALTGNASGVASSFLGIMGNDQQQKLIDRQMETATPEYGRGGNMSANVGAYGYRTPYFIKSRPICSIPKQHTHLNGIPSDRSLLLGDIAGYVEVDTAEISFKCRDDERAEILSLLKGGVYV